LADRDRSDQPALLSKAVDSKQTEATLASTSLSSFSSISSNKHTKLRAKTPFPNAFLPSKPPLSTPLSLLPTSILIPANLGPLDRLTLKDRAVEGRRPEIEEEKAIEKEDKVARSIAQKIEN